MILYKTNGNWFGDIGHLFKSWTMTRIVRSVVAIGVYVYLKIVVTVYGMLLPLGLVESFGWTAVPVTIFVFFALPTNDIAHTIKKNVFEILEDRSPKEEQKDELYTKVF